MANYEDRKTGFNMSSMPRTIQDAITIASWVNVRYIWVDAICIIQDSRADWEQEGGRMDRIYLSSSLTISADDTPDTQAGILHQRNRLSGQSCVHPELVSPYDKPTPGGFYGNNHRWITQRVRDNPGLPVPLEPRVICCGIEDADKSINTGLLSDRGWILQERLLSRRILHWGAFEVSWECNGMIASERKPAGQPTQKAQIDVRGLLHAIQNIDDGYGLNAIVSREGCAKWHELVSQFASRKLTVLSDRLPAIAGLSNAFGASLQYQQSDYVFGLWKPKLRYDLCWMKTGQHDQTATGNITNSGIPSFSWASVTDPVRFLEVYLHETSTENVEILGYHDKNASIHGFYQPSIELKGSLFELSRLEKSRPTNRVNDLEGLTGAIFWDVKNQENLERSSQNVYCMCFGIINTIDSVDIPREAQGLFGILLERQSLLEVGGNGVFSRVGFYDGLFPPMELEGLSKETVMVI